MKTKQELTEKGGNQGDSFSEIWERVYSMAGDGKEYVTAQEEGLEVDGGSVVRDTGGDVLALTSVERSLNSVLNTLGSYCRFMESVDTF